MIQAIVPEMIHNPPHLPALVFKRWYPDMDIEVDEMPVAA
jgi:hypothetical protein